MIMTLNIANRVPLPSVSSTSSGVHIIGDTVGTLDDLSSSCGGVSHDVDRTAEVADSDAEADEVTIETFGLEDGNEGGRTKTERARAI